MRWFNDLRLHWQLLGAFGAILLVMGIAGAFSVYKLVQVTESYHLAIDATYATENDVHNLDTLFITRDNILKEVYLFNVDSQTVQQGTDRITELDNQISDGFARLRANRVLRPEDVDVIDRAAKSYADYQAASQAALALTHGNTDAYSLQQAAANLTAGQAEPVSAALDDLSTRTRQHTADEVGRIEPLVQSLVPILIGVLVLSGLLGLGGAVLFARNLAHAVAEVSSAARGLADGDLGQEITLARKDELGDTAESIRGMIAYQQMLAGTADALARGDLQQDVKPRSEHDVLGRAFAGMVANVRDLVTSIEKEQARRNH